MLNQTLICIDLFGNVVDTTEIIIKPDGTVDQVLKNVENGFMTINEARKSFGLEPLKDGDELGPGICEHCGAPVDLHSDKCPYCDVPYSSVWKKAVDILSRQVTIN